MYSRRGEQEYIAFLERAGAVVRVHRLAVAARFRDLGAPRGERQHVIARELLDLKVVVTPGTNVARVTRVPMVSAQYERGDGRGAAALSCRPHGLVRGAHAFFQDLLGSGTVGGVVNVPERGGNRSRGVFCIRPVRNTFGAGEQYTVTCVLRIIGYR